MDRARCFLSAKRSPRTLVQLRPQVRVTVGVSGTGGGASRSLLNQEIDISDASRPIKASEAAKAVAAGIRVY